MARTIAEIKTGGRVLRIERKCDCRGVAHARLHVINLSRRGDSEGPIYWLPPSSLLPFIAALTGIADGTRSETARIALNDAGKFLMVGRRPEGIWLSVQVLSEARDPRSTEASPIIVAATQLPELLVGIKAAAKSFGLEVALGKKEAE